MYQTIVNVEDYLQYSGVDLNDLLANKLATGVDNPAPLFIEGIEKWCLDYLQAHYSFDGTLIEGNQKEQFKKGVIFQIDYVIENGSLFNESGYSQERGLVIPRSELDKISLAPNAYMAFRLGGLANMLTI